MRCRRDVFFTFRRHNCVRTSLRRRTFFVGWFYTFDKCSSVSRGDGTPIFTRVIPRCITTWTRCLVFFNSTRSAKISLLFHRVHGSGEKLHIIALRYNYNENFPARCCCSNLIDHRASHQCTRVFKYV